MAPPATEEVKWLKHYSSVHHILTVGDGDFSFSLSLATAFGSGKNIVATSLDSYTGLLYKHHQAGSNVAELKILGTKVLHGVDAEDMNQHTYLKTKRFDRIVFNFPHTGFHGNERQLCMINSHKKLVRGFFHNSSQLLCPGGEIHITHKTGYPYDSWDLELSAMESSLFLFEKAWFHQSDYPGYRHKRGDGAKCNRSFPLRNLNFACTFKFRVVDSHPHASPESTTESGDDDDGDGGDEVAGLLSSLSLVNSRTVDLRIIDQITPV